MPTTSIVLACSGGYDRIYLMVEYTYCYIGFIDELL